MVTEIARRTQAFVRTSALTVTCEVNTCKSTTKTVDSGAGSFDETFIECDPSKCENLNDLMPKCMKIDSDNVDGDLTPRCNPAAYIALDLSDPEFESLPIPKMMVPGLAALYKGDQQAFATSFYASSDLPEGTAGSRNFRVLKDQQALVELAVASNVAFLTAVADTIPDQIPAACFTQ